MEYDLITAHEAARMARCSVQAIYEWSARKEFPRIRLGRLVRFERSDIEEWIDRNREPFAEA